MPTFGPPSDDGMDIDLSHLDPATRAAAEQTRAAIRLIPTDMASVLPDTPERGPGTVYPCPLVDCNWELFVAQLEVGQTALASVFGIGVMASAAAAQQMARTEEQLSEHLEEHTVVAWSKTVSMQREHIVGLQSQLQDVLGRLAAEPVHVPRIQTMYTPPSASQDYPSDAYQEVEVLRRENELLRSRQAQESFDPLKATPRYSDQLPEGVVGVRR